MILGNGQAKCDCCGKEPILPYLGVRATPVHYAFPGTSDVDEEQYCSVGCVLTALKAELERIKQLNPALVGGLLSEAKPPEPTKPNDNKADTPLLEYPPPGYVPTSEIRVVGNLRHVTGNVVLAQKHFNCVTHNTMWCLVRRGMFRPVSDSNDSQLRELH